jgi:hypothetical protein
MNIDKMVENKDICGIAKYIDACNNVALKGSGYEKYRAFMLKMDALRKTTPWIELNTLEEFNTTKPVEE